MDIVDASIVGDIRLVRELLDSGVDPNFRDIDGQIALMVASLKGYTDIVRLLLENGADPNIRDIDGVTGLILASKNGYVDIVRLLLKNGADPNLKDEDGYTALILASKNGYTETVKLLLEKRADPNIQPYDKENTALIQASKNGYVDIVRLLLENGANPNIISQYGYQRYGTALQAAKYYGAQDVVELLESYIRSTKIQSRFRGRQTRRKARTQKALQQLKALRLPVDYDVSKMIGERLSRMPYNPEVAKRIREERENERIADYLNTIEQYGMGKHGKKRSKKRSGKKKSKTKKKKYLLYI